MTRNLKALGLALFAVFALSAVLAAGAQAQIKATLGASPAWLTGEAIEHPGIGKAQTFTLLGGQVLTCEEGKFTATVKNGDTSITMAPTLGKCHAKIGAEKLLATVTTNDCDFLFHGGKEVSPTTFNEGETDLVCPAGKVVEVHVYKSAVSEAEELCTYKAAPFVNKVGGEFHNVAGSPNEVTITATASGFAITRTGSLLCGTASTTGTYTGSTTVKAFEDLGGTISNGTASGLVEGNQVSLTASK